MDNWKFVISAKATKVIVLGLLCTLCVALAYVHVQPDAGYLSGLVHETAKINTTNVSLESDKSCMAWNKIAEYVKNCVTKAISSTQPGDLWNKLNNHINSCTANIRELIGVQFLINNDEPKGFIDYVDNVGRNSCVMVTLGIGNDIEAERKLLKLVPNCRLFGADPILASGQVYNQIGKYFQLAVSGESFNQTASVLENGGYKPMNLEHLGFVDFITKLLNLTTVDFLWLDAEGAEYRILPLLISGGAIDTAGITICQIATEMHDPVTNYQSNVAEWEQMITKLVTNSDFIPIWSGTSGHYRLFLINYKNPICVRKFFKNWC